MNDSALRKNLVELLQGGHAYPTVEKALAGMKKKNRHLCPMQNLHSIWEELEHMRIAQEDILHYTLNSRWKSPPWPQGYWPSPKEALTDARWSASVKDFLADRKELIALAGNPRVDLTAEIPHGEGRTYLREILLAADHNAYHTGQIIVIRKLLGDWLT